MHLKRWITSIIALPLLFLLIVKGPPFLFAVFVGAVCLIALWEYFGIVFHPLGPDKRIMMPGLGFLIGSFIIFAAYRNSFQLMMGLVSLNLLLAGLISLFDFKTDKDVMQHVYKQVLGVVYIPFFLSFLVLIRNGESGAIWICFLLCIIFAGDTAAYYVGTYFGKHKLCPAVSPKKTFEGAIGGLLANLLVGALFKTIFLTAGSWVGSILFFLSVGIAGQVGDLFESEHKRLAGIKDSSGILPGHGGVLDRFDALLFAAPAAYFFKAYLL
ncbi:phosphatidate cytidylyltransferase [Thermodesulfobacteriota bacterium]